MGAEASLEDLPAVEATVVYGDPSMAEAAVDVSGRPLFVFNAEIGAPKVGDFDTELAEEFFRAFIVNARLTAHLNLRYGRNAHHCIEGLFKAFARALGGAIRLDPRLEGVIPSTKGVLET